VKAEAHLVVFRAKVKQMFRNREMERLPDGDRNGAQNVSATAKSLPPPAAETGPSGYAISLADQREQTSTR
jgi:hypothetical protein